MTSKGNRGDTNKRTFAFEEYFKKFISDQGRIQDAALEIFFQVLFD